MRNEDVPQPPGGTERRRTKDWISAQVVVSHPPVIPHLHRLPGHKVPGFRIGVERDPESRHPDKDIMSSARWSLGLTLG